MIKKLIIVLAVLTGVIICSAYFLMPDNSKADSADISEEAAGITAESAENADISGSTTVSGDSSDNTSTPVDSSDNQNNEEDGKDKDKIVKITISAAGDCTLGVDSRYNNAFNNKYNEKNSSYFLKKVKKIFSKDDLTIVNLEGTLTDSTDRAVKTYTFKGPQKYVNILKQGSVEAVTVANNHSMDFGEQGFKDTKAAVKNAGIKCFGYDTISYKKIKGERIAMIGVNALSSQGSQTSYVKTLIKKAKKKKSDLIIIYFHWGIERDALPNSTQMSLAHESIDCGADLVLGSHPHVVQGIEKYKGKYIVYSMGNFCFGGNSNPEDKDTMIFSQTFTFKNDKLINKKNAKVIPCSLSGVSYTNDFQPRILSESERTRVLNKIKDRSKGMNIKIRKNGTIK